MFTPVNCDPLDISTHNDYVNIACHYATMSNMYCILSSAFFIHLKTYFPDIYPIFSKASDADNSGDNVTWCLLCVHLVL